MDVIDQAPRKCIQCKSVKEYRAFLGHREICRSCWILLSKEEKELYALENKIYSKKIANMRNYDLLKSKGSHD